KAQQTQDAQAFQQQAAAEPAPAEPAPAAAAPASGTDDVIAQLKELAELKSQGILTEEEFAAQKAKILG
ncbi:MAG: SHOCT domain-containing protein, partial [Microthrixaceae bacterium]